MFPNDLGLFYAGSGNLRLNPPASSRSALAVQFLSVVDACGQSVLRTDAAVVHRTPAFRLRPDALALAKQPFF